MPVETSNLPQGVQLRHYLLFGQRPIFNLKPVPEEEFVKEFGLKISTVEALAEEGLVLPVMYTRDPQSWKGYKHLEPLIRLSSETGVSVDAYMHLRDPNYSDKVLEHEETLSRLFQALNPKGQAELVEYAGVFDLSGFARGLARRWGYIDVLKPSESTVIGKKFIHGKIRDAISYLNAAKTILASDITSAYGGTFCWGPSDASIKESTAWSALMNVPEHGPKHFPILRFPEGLEYLFSREFKTEPYEVSVNDETLKDFLRKEEISGFATSSGQQLGTLSRLRHKRSDQVMYPWGLPSKLELLSTKTWSGNTKNALRCSG